MNTPTLLAAELFSAECEFISLSNRLVTNAWKFQDAEAIEISRDLLAQLNDCRELVTRLLSVRG